MRDVRVGVGVLVVREGKLLLGKRHGSHGAGTWSPPGGKLEFGESIEECARRELSEETSLVGDRVSLGPYANTLFAEIEEQYLTVFAIVHDATGEPATMEPNKCDGWHWFDWNDLPSPLFQPLQTLVASGYVLM